MLEFVPLRLGETVMEMNVHPPYPVSRFTVLYCIFLILLVYLNFGDASQRFLFRIGDHDREWL